VKRKKTEAGEGGMKKIKEKRLKEGMVVN